MTKQILLIKDNIIHMTFLLLCLGPIIATFFLKTDGQIVYVDFEYYKGVFGEPCAFKELTSYNCPSCGMTRAYIYMRDFNIVDAFKINYAGAMLYFFCVIQSLYRIIILYGINLPYKKTISRFGYIVLIFIGILTIYNFTVQFFT